jgi:CheY-like chemotaxis protein
VSTDTTRKYGGSGLGLFISKGLAELMGGNIILASDEGVGTTFTVTLNVKKSDTQVLNNETQSPVTFEPLVGIRVLVADDIAINREIVAKFLKKWKVTFDFAENGLEVLSRLKVQRYDLILLDLHMPELDGFDAAIQIRKGNIQNNIPIIALTASVETETQGLIKDIGINDYISKPFLRADLYRKISKLTH